MIKRVFSIFVTLLLIISIPLCSFASVNYEEYLSSNLFTFAEPPDLSNTIYWALGDGSGSILGNDCFLFITVFPYLSREQFETSEITIQIKLYSDKQTLWIWAPTLPNISFYQYVFRGDGLLLDQHVFSLDNDGLFNYDYTAFSSYHYYWAKGNLSVINLGSYGLLRPIWNDDYVTNYNLSQIVESLQNGFNLSITTELATYNQLQTFYNLFDTYKNLWTSWSQNNIQLLNQQLIALSNIQNKLQQLLDNLGVGQTQPNFEENTGFSNDVEDLESRQHSIIDQFDNLDIPLDLAFNSVDGYIGSLRAPLLFIKSIFDTFIPDGSLPWIIIFFSLVFGLIATLIGKKIRSS